MKRLVALALSAFVAWSPMATAFPFAPNQVLTAADLNAALQTAAITSGTIDSATITNSPISGSTGSFTTMTSPSVSITGGLINNTSIGATTPAAGTFSSVSSPSVTVTGGTINNTSIGATTPAAGTFSTLSTSSATVTGGTLSNTAITNSTIDSSSVGATTPSSGSFTTLGASSTVSGTGFSNYLASPPSIGSTTPGTGAFTTLSATTANPTLYYQSGATGSVANTYASKFGERISVFDFLTAAEIAEVKGGSPTTDLATPLANFEAYVASTHAVGVFPAGTYLYSVSPNWAADGVTYVAEGRVYLRYSGTGNAVIFDGGAATSQVVNMRWLGDFVVEAPSTAQNGYFVRSVNHSTFEGTVIGAGTTYAGLLINFAVADVFKVNTSPLGFGAWYLSAQPQNGIVATQRGAGEETSANTFIDPIIEGVSGDGISLDYALNNTFIGGTAELNTGYGVVTSANAWTNKFLGLDMESNTAGDVSENGAANYYQKVYSTSTITIASGVYGTTIQGGFLNTITDNGTGTLLQGFRFGISGGTLSGSPTDQTRQNLINAVGPTYAYDISAGSLFGSVATTSGVAATALTLPSTSNGNGLYIVYAYIQGTGAATLYDSYAVIAQDGASATILTQVNATNLTITLSGQNIQVTQTSGAAATVYVKANLQ